LPHKLDPPAYIRDAANQTLALKPGKDVMDCRGRAQFEVRAYFGDCRRVPMCINVAAQVIIDLPLSGANRHTCFSPPYKENLSKIIEDRKSDVNVGCALVEGALAIVGRA
jgi:hypothetical protein